MRPHKPDHSQSNAQKNGSRPTLLVVLVTGHAIKHIFNAAFFVLLPELKIGLGLSNVGVGTISTVRSFGGGIINLPAGFVGDRYRNHFVPILAVTMALVGVFQFALGHAESYWHAIIAVTLITCALTFWHPAAIGALSRTFLEKRGFAISMHGTGGSIGEASGPILVGALLVILTWRGVLQTSLVPALIFGFLIWVLLRSSTATPHIVTFNTYLRAVSNLLTNSKLVIIMFITAAYASSQGAVMTFLPVYIREDLGLSSLALGSYLSLAQVVGIGWQPLMGYLSDRVGRKTILAPNLMGVGLSFLGLYLAPPGLPFIIMLAVTGAFIFSIMALLLAAGSDIVSHDVQATTVSLLFATWIVFSGLSSLGAGLVADTFGVRQVFLYGSIFGMAAAILAFTTPWQHQYATKDINN